MTSPILREPESHFSTKDFSHQSLHHFKLFLSLFFSMADMPVLSQATKDLLAKVRMIVPPLLEKFHKGAYPGQNEPLSTPRCHCSF